MRQFIAAVGFLTVIPVPSRSDLGGKDLGGSIIYFPLVGALAGVALAGLDWGLQPILPSLPSAALVVTAMVVISGGLHMDGLADTADGFFSHASRDRALEIMKDSRIGPMGVLAVISVFVMKFSAIAATDPGSRWMALLMAPVAGRLAMEVCLSTAPYVRGSSGLGSAFVTNPKLTSPILGLVFTSGLGVLTCGGAGVVIVVSALAVTLLFSMYSYRRIGGMTGDTYGAVCELAETASLIAACACFPGGLL